jgi:hypothetical protein
MTRNVAEAARVLGVAAQQLKTWAWAYKDHLNTSANPGKGEPRTFTDSDVLALMYVCDRSLSGETAEEISLGLDREDHYSSDRYRELLYAHTPILQELPDDLDEPWRHGILLADRGMDGYLALARNYRDCAQTLLEGALKSGEARDWGFPVLFAYRHTLELYLKIIGQIERHTHSLLECMLLVEKRHGELLPLREREWIIELDDLDPGGTTFRYVDGNAGKALDHGEYWVDFVQFKYAMNRVFWMLDTAILKASGDGRNERL